MKPKVLQFTFALFFIALQFSTFSQNLPYGTAVTGNITSLGQVDTYTFNGTAGDVVLIRMRGKSGGVDGCIELFDPNGNSIAADCDDGGLVKIDGLALPTTGLYTIKAQDSGDNDKGNYGIACHVLNNPAMTTAMACGDDLMEALEHNAEIDAYHFSAKAGNQIWIQMRSAASSLEAQLELYDANGNQIASGNTAVGLTTIKDLTLAEDGNYTIIAMDENGNDLGYYGLSLQIINDSNCAEAISCGLTLSRDIGLIAEVDAYTFTASTSDHILINMVKNNPSIESELELYGPSGELVSADAPAEGMATIELNGLPVDGEYLLLVKDGKGNDTGTYSLSLQMLNNSNCVETIECNTLSLTTDLELGGEIDIYAIELAQGDVFNARMRGVLNGIDSYLKLIGPDGTLLVEDYANSAMAEIVDFVLPADGLYSLLATDRNGNDIGDYGISIYTVPAPSVCSIQLDCETSTYEAALTNFAEADVYTFSGKERQVLTIVMEEVDIALEPSMKLYGPNGALLAEQQKSLHADFTSFVLPADGLYSVVATDKNGNDIGAYTINFTLDNENGTTTCATCDDGVQNDDETGVDCGGANCPDCCPPEGTQCILCPEDLTITCPESEEVDAPKPVWVQGAGTYDMTIRFNDFVADSGNCQFGNITFDNGCVGIRTACWNRRMKFTPEFATCGGPLPDLPFTIDFGNGLKVAFDANGDPTVLPNAELNTVNDQIDAWLAEATSAEDCDLVSITHDYNADLTIAECDGSQVVTFTGVDVCGNVSTCTATLTLTDGTPICPDYGTPCDDGDINTFNDIEDGACNCAGAPYCESTGENTSYEYIAYVALNDLSNQTGDDQGYGDYTGLSTDLMQGTGYTLQLTPGFTEDSYVEHWNIWVDWNQDGSFAEEERVLSAASSEKIEETIEVPSNALLGNTRMRVSMAYLDEGEEANLSPCDALSYGEVEDYTVNLILFTCPEAGTACDDGNENTIDDVEDGNCNCEGIAVEDRCGTGTISRDVFLGVPGYPLSNIDWDATPDISDEMELFEIPINQYEHYGTRLRGYLCPPVSGDYTFWISSDDKGELWLSSDDNPDNIALVAEVPGWTYPRVWNKYPEQKSVTIYLEKGQSYYVEAFMKEHEGLDNLAVGWQLPDGTLERPILGSSLSPYFEPESNVFDDNNNNNTIVPSLSSAEIQLSPNPANEVLNVDVSDFMGEKVQLSISNNMGQVMYVQSIEEVNTTSISIDLSQLPVKNGYYQVAAQSSKQVSAKPLIISKGDL
ncbi:MAG: GEVED domain-containing protein [Bacteroidota bacterium]